MTPPSNHVRICCFRHSSPCYPSHLFATLLFCPLFFRPLLFITRLCSSLQYPFLCHTSVTRSSLSILSDIIFSTSDNMFTASYPAIVVYCIFAIVVAAILILLAGHRHGTGIRCGAVFAILVFVLQLALCFALLTVSAPQLSICHLHSLSLPSLSVSIAFFVEYIATLLPYILFYSLPLNPLFSLCVHVCVHYTQPHALLLPDHLPLQTTFTLPPYLSLPPSLPPYLPLCFLVVTTRFLLHKTHFLLTFFSPTTFSLRTRS